MIPNLKKWINFSRMSTFFLSKIFFPMKKILKMKYILHKFLNFFERIFEKSKISNFMEPAYKSTEISYECYLSKFIKHFIKSARIQQELLEKRWKFLNIWEKIVCEGIEENAWYFMNISIRQGKVRNLSAKVYAFSPKNEENFEIFKEFLSCFYKNLLGKLTFS